MGIWAILIFCSPSEARARPPVEPPVLDDDVDEEEFAALEKNMIVQEARNEGRRVQRELEKRAICDEGYGPVTRDLGVEIRQWLIIKIHVNPAVLVEQTSPPSIIFHHMVPDLPRAE